MARRLYTDALFRGVVPRLHDAVGRYVSQTGRNGMCSEACRRTRPRQQLARGSGVSCPSRISQEAVELEAAIQISDG